MEGCSGVTTKSTKTTVSVSTQTLPDARDLQGGYLEAQCSISSAVCITCEELKIRPQLLKHEACQGIRVAQKFLHFLLTSVELTSQLKTMGYMHVQLQSIAAQGLNNFFFI